MALIPNFLKNLKGGLGVFTDPKAREEAVSGLGIQASELGKGISEIARKIPATPLLPTEKLSSADLINFGREMAQGITRFAARTTMGAIDVGRDIEKVPGALLTKIKTGELPVFEDIRPTELKLDPQASALEKAFFKSVLGTERVSGFAEAVAKQELKEEPIPLLGGKGKGAVAPLAIVASAMDFTGIGGGRKGLVKLLTETTDPVMVARILEKIGIARDVIGNYAEAFARATKSVDVENGLTALERFLKTTKKAVEEAPEALKRADIPSPKTSQELLPTLPKPQALPRPPQGPVKTPRVLVLEIQSYSESVIQKSRLVKERGFLESIRESPQVTKETKELVENLPVDQRYYDIYTDKTAVEAAGERISKGSDEALNFVLQADRANKDVITTGIELMRRYRMAGNFTMEAEIAANIAEKGTRAGQGVQAFSILNKMSPEGIIITATKRLQQNISSTKLTQLKTETERVVKEMATVQREVSEQAAREVSQGRLFDIPFIEKVAKITKPIEQAVSRGIKEAEINLTKIVREHYSVVEQARGSLAEKLVAQANIPVEEASKLARQIESRFNELVKIKKEQVLKAIFKERTPSDKTIIDKIIEFSNLGAFDSATYRPLIAQRLKIPQLSEHLARKLVAQDEKIQQLPFGYEQYKATQELFEILAREAPKPLGKRVGDFLLELANVPRALMASFWDLSGSLRQGILMFWRHPKLWKESFMGQFGAFLKEANYNAMMDTIMKNPEFKNAVDAGVGFTDVNAKLSLREERYMSSIAEKIPLIGRQVRATNRAYTIFMNKIRMDTFSQHMKILDDLGLRDADHVKKTADLINDMTGRGDIPKALQSMQAWLNAIFFSPKLNAARIHILAPVRYINAPAHIRKEYLKTMLSFSAGTGTILALADVAGLEVSFNSNSADFLKLKYKNTRLDIMGGFQQFIRIGSQIISGKYVGSTTGKIITLGEGYKPLTRWQVFFRGVESKEAPAFSLFSLWMAGQDMKGEPVNWPAEIGNRLMPILFSDLYELYQEDPKLLPLGFLGALGVGIQSYEQPEAYIKLNEIRNADDPVVAFNELMESDPKLAQKVERAGIESTFTEFDWSLTYMGVENGRRAEFLVEYFNKLSSNEARIAKWNDLVEKKLLSKNVQEQINFLIENPGTTIKK